MNNAWVCRAGVGGELAEDFERLGLVAIGYGVRESIAERSPDEIEALIAEGHPEFSPNQISARRGYLWTFLKDVKAGDLILTPVGDTRTLLVGRVTGEYRYDASHPFDLSHTRSVEWLDRIRVTELSTSPRRSLKASSTLFSMSQHRAELQRAITGGHGAPTISSGTIEQLVQLVRDQAGDWTGFEEPGFIRDEITYKREASQLASDLLGAQALAEAREQGDYEEVIDRIKKVAQATNLLVLGVPQKGDLATINHPELDVGRFSDAFFDLLHGEGDSIDRLERYLEWAEDALPNYANKWTFPTYFLFLLAPAKEIFVRPQTTREFLEFIGSDLTLDPDPDPGTYHQLCLLYEELRVALEEYRPHDMIDLQGFVGIAMQEHRARKARRTEATQEIGEEVVEAFQLLREEPAARFRRVLHQHRIGQLRALLSDPDALSVDIFNREVWPLESSTVLGGEELKRGIGERIDQSPFTEERYRELEEALEAGDLELHGNYIWGSGSRVYAPQIQEEPKQGSNLAWIVDTAREAAEPLTAELLADRARAAGWRPENDAVATVHELVAGKPEFFGQTPGGEIRLLTEDESRLRNIRRAAEILVDEARAPIEKAHAIMAIKGFGRNTATGLVMVFHPDEFAIYNDPSKEGLERLGLDASTLEGFQASAAQLKDAVGAADFLELDTFLFLIGTGKLKVGPQGEPGQGYGVESSRVWWINQGDSYSEELAEGIVWAPLETTDGKVISPYSAVGDLRPGDRVLHYSNTALRAIGKVLSEPAHAEKPGGSGKGYENRVGNLVRIRYTELDEPIELAAIPSEWRLQERGPFNRTGAVNQGYCYPVSVLLACRLATKFSQLQELRTALGSGDSWQKICEEELPYVASYEEPAFEEIVDAVRLAGMKISERLLRRYHLSLQTRGFVILSGISGTGKTWLTRLYADAVGAEYRLVPVAPNWTSNEDLLGFWNPLTDAYHDTPFSRFLREAADEYDRATSVGVLPKPYHLALDELNLARVEYYFARFLSAMEVRARHGFAEIQLGPDDVVTLPENLFFVGTINVDETTHGFADKVFDRAQLLELEAPRDLLWRHLGESQYRDTVMAVWDEVERIAPFAFRVLDDIQAYVALAEDMGVGWEEAVDEQLVQKVLPKLKGADPRIGQALLGIIDVAGEDLPLTREKAREMNETFNQHGFTSYF